MNDSIEVWRASLEITPRRQSALIALLSKDERAKAARFRFEADRRRYIAARGTLRELLAGYLNHDAAGLEFAYGEQGKPFLKLPPGNKATPLYFNLSHSDDVALFAVTTIGAVGIDLERIRPDFEIGNMVTRFFAPEEAVILSGLSASARNERFFRFWTRKEAYCKALGDGFALDPRRMDASASPPAPADWFSLKWDGVPNPRIALRDLDADSDCAAALAIAGEAKSVVLREWDETR